jgi:hypothetical protein
MIDSPNGRTCLEIFLSETTISKIANYNMPTWCLPIIVSIVSFVSEFLGGASPSVIFCLAIGSLGQYCTKLYIFVYRFILHVFHISRE